MNRLDKAKKILISAESNIRSLVGDAANAGEYDETLNLTNIAKAMANLSKSLNTPRPTEATISRKASKNGSAATPTIQRSNGKAKSKNAKRAKSKKYPRFIQNDGELIKVGWSKSSSKEYQHKAPRDVLNAVVGAIKVQRLDDGTLRPPQEFLPLANANGDPIPDYQSYLCIAWLRAIGIVERQGRHGYCVPNSTSLEQQIEDAWNLLKTT